jgi:hypothetical protein
MSSSPHVTCWLGGEDAAVTATRTRSSHTLPGRGCPAKGGTGEGKGTTESICDSHRETVLNLVRRKDSILFAAAIVVLCSLASPARTQPTDTKSATTLQGKLLDLPGSGPALKTKEKQYPLIARTIWLFHTLQDKRLENREVRLEGVIQADGTFRVNQLYTVREGKLFRVRYFCEVCNIEALEPGNCVFCQQPTELQEIPVPEK